MEIFARIALSKYLKPKRVKTESEALQKLFDEGLWEYLQSFDSQQWKKDRLYNFECSACLNENYDQLMKLFKKYRGKYSKPGSPQAVSIEEFLSMVIDSSVLTTEPSIGNAELGAQYNMSMSTLVNEFESDRHFQMQFDEFVEAVARVAEKINKYPMYKAPTKKKTSIQLMLVKQISQSIVNTEDSKIIDLKGQPLHVKVQMLISILK